MRNILMQFVKKNPVLSYLTEAWQKVGLQPAYPHYLLELPTWMARVPVEPNGIHLEGVSTAQSKPEDGDCVWGSVLDVTLPEWLAFVKASPRINFRLGGYVNPAHFRPYPNVKWLDSLSEEHYWSVFSGWRCIPRLALSRGCPYPCSFCTIERKLTERSQSAIFDDAASFEPLCFRHIYIDDKSFGLASNYRLLPEITRIVRRYNPTFQGYIVQSTVNLTRKHWKEWEDLGVKFFEVGVETLDEATLRDWRKPHSNSDIWALLGEWPMMSKNLIPNIVMGQPGQLYDETAEWLCQGYAFHQISFANFYMLTAYPTQQHVVNLGYGNVVPSDADENNTKRSWLSSEESERIESWRNNLMAMFLGKEESDAPASL